MDDLVGELLFGPALLVAGVTLPAGKVEVESGRVEGVSIHGFVGAGPAVEVSRVDRARVVVTPVASTQQESS